MLQNHLAVELPVRDLRGFTLVELLAVVGLIAVFAGVIGFAFMRGAGQTVGLQAAQSSLVAMLTLARGEAAVSGRDTAVFVCVSSSDPERPFRYLNAAYLDGTTWKSLTTGIYLPADCYVVPYDLASATFEASTLWSSLNSTALREDLQNRALNSNDATEDWIGVRFNPRGATSSGNIVMTTARRNPPDVDPPVVFRNPEGARGVTVSTYGLARLIDDHTGF